TNVCCGLNLAASTRAPHRPHSTEQNAAWRSSLTSICSAARGDGTLIPPRPPRRGTSQVLRHLGLPAGHRAGRVDLELEPRRHVRLDVGHITGELLVPA